jgi:DNA gyrase subunit A
MKEPTLLPTTFPNILISPNLGIAVGMACSICSFNLAEICDGTIALLKNPKTTVERMLEIVKAPDFSGGATILYDYEQMKKIYLTGTGSFKMQAKYEYNKEKNCIDILQIPYSSCIEAIIKKSVDMIKAGKLREVTDVRDSIDISSTRLLTFDLKKDADPDLVIKKLMSATELQNNFDCNFNILVEGKPMLLGIREILTEWIKFRMKCLTRELNFTLGKKEEKLHLLLGLAAILLDIDKAIKIIRHTEEEKDVVPNLAAAFNITTVQAEYVADIKLRNLNSQYILNRVKEIEELRADIDEIKEKLRDELKLKAVIIDQLKEIKKKYGKPRMTEIVDKSTVTVVNKEEIFFENYNCRVIMSKGGYFKKLSLQGMRSADEQKLKEGDYIIYEADTENRSEVMFFTDKAQIYRAKIADIELSKPSEMGKYIPAELQMDNDERVVGCQIVNDLIPEHHLIYIFENGKGVRIPMSAYDSKSKRRKISGACSTASPIIGVFYESEKPIQIFLRSDLGRGLLIKSDLIPEKTTRTSQGVQIMQFSKKNGKLELATDRIDSLGADVSKCKKTAIPSTGSIINQISFNF